MRLWLLSFLGLIGLASAACYRDVVPGSSAAYEKCTTAKGVTGWVTNCDEESAAAANCDDGGASIYLAPTYCCPS
ncbi:uncharacterized protein LTHEOB_8573 [Lasiodiplodia theobromae]|uniref:uncharacterized protein n=1 Tax=Lasiodiplodia theobromae TaxID=45133 RepID=UPI0015C2CBEF|nr:uncharacterized protein LTHEOB_8573 [Lasiodiplodia theobromae]KAF4541578.1 hypothetical protein LTHEOB_8573 [Lasiodiplodia theobromae]